MQRGRAMDVAPPRRDRAAACCVRRHGTGGTRAGASASQIRTGSGKRHAERGGLAGSDSETRTDRLVDWLGCHLTAWSNAQVRFDHLVKWRNPRKGALRRAWVEAEMLTKKRGRGREEEGERAVRAVMDVETQLVFIQ